MLKYQAFLQRQLLEESMPCRTCKLCLHALEAHVSKTPEGLRRECDGSHRPYAIVHTFSLPSLLLLCAHTCFVTGSEGGFILQHYLIGHKSQYHRLQMD